MITLAAIQAATRAKNYAQAEQDIAVFLHDLFGFAIARVAIRQDNLSLNSVNGIIHLLHPDPKTGENALFFKFHHEENEEALTEYYNSRLLADHDYPVDVPVYVSQAVGKQILIYAVKNSRRLFDVCKELDADPGNPLFSSVVEAQAQLDQLCCERYISTLHAAKLESLYDEPILQLFARRLTDNLAGSSHTPGGRYALFYDRKICVLPDGLTLNFEQLGRLKWRINGLDYNSTLIENFEKSLRLLRPEAHLLPDGTYPAVIAHGDAHNGNVWYNEGNPAELSLFDPAFAGRHIPALLAEIKATFHNIFAHPLWLYDAQEADEKLEIHCRIAGDYIIVDHNWQPGPLRTAFLQSKQENLWKPLLNTLNAQALLIHNWEDYMRLALFCCPTLVMNLRANAGSAQNSHTPKTSLLGFAIATMLATPPQNGDDSVSVFFAGLKEGV